MPNDDLKRKERACAKCGAKTRKGTLCKRRAGERTAHEGTGRCYLHGGSSPQAELSGAAEVASAEVRRLGLMPPIAIHPAQVLLECIANSWGEVKYWQAEVERLDEKEVAAPTITQTRRPQQVGRGEEDPNKMVVETTLGPPELHIAIRARADAEIRAVKFSESALRAGLEERLVKQAEGAADIVAPIVTGALEKILGRELTDADRSHIHSAILERASKRKRLGGGTS